MPLTVTPLDRTTLRVIFPVGMQVEHVLDPESYVIYAHGGAYPINILSVAPIYTTLASGVQGTIQSDLSYPSALTATMHGGSRVTADLTRSNEVSLRGDSAVRAELTFKASTVGPVLDSYFRAEDGSFSGGDVGTYLFLTSEWNNASFLRIVSVTPPGIVGVDRPLLGGDPQNGQIPWFHTTGITGVMITTAGSTDGGSYEIVGGPFTDVMGNPYSFDTAFTGVSTKPRVLGAVTYDDGSVLVTFDREMRLDTPLTDPNEYSIVGSLPPSASSGAYGVSLYGIDPYGFGVRQPPPPEPLLEITGVSTVSPTQVMLRTVGMQTRSYVVRVNAVGTPHDAAGNPIDPAFNQAVFMGSPPLNTRSIFVNKGPIARPPLTLQMGVGLAFLAPDTLTFTGGVFGQSLLGLFVTIGGTTHNDGTYQILGVLAGNKLRVKASFTLPDTGALMATWAVFDPRDGEIADDPAHVTVRINSVPVRPEAVIGLLGQIVLPSVPAPTDNVEVDYAWVRNPTVEIRRLNSREFRLNNWNQDQGRLHDTSRHKYRFNNILPVPSNFTSPAAIQQGAQATVTSSTVVHLGDGLALSSFAGLNLAILAGPNAGVYDIVSVLDPSHVTVAGPLTVDAVLRGWTIGDSSDLQAILPQPLLRDLKYRAYERAYTAVLNDPNTLRLNSPSNRIAFPPLQRTVTSSFIDYEPSVLPENDPTAPWNRVGGGSASVSAGSLTVTAVTAPPGNFLYWNRGLDLTFPHIFAATWFNQITATPTTQGVFTGVAYGYSDDQKAIVFGYLLDGTTAKVGFLKKGSGNDPSVITSWTGGLDSNNTSTGAPVALDWTILHSFRIYQDATGTIHLYLDGGIVETLRVTSDELPSLSELDAPFSSLQGTYFGHLSRTALSTSVWDFVRYTVLPLNPLQTAPSIFVSYEGNILPETALSPWTPLGYHGTETILNSNLLLLDSTSAISSPTTYVGGDFRGYIRLEPLLATNAQVVYDIDVAIRTWTHGITPNAVTAMVDDGDRLIQLSFLADVAAPKISYGGDALPPSLTPPWTEITGGAPSAAMVGRTLRVVNPTSADALLYIFDDTALPTSPSRILGANDYILEARMQPKSYTADAVTGFVGASVQTYDGTKTLGLYLADNGSRSIVVFGVDAFGVVSVVATVPFEWLDGNPHTYRLVYAHVAGLVSLFVDGVFASVVGYSSFPTPPVTTAYVSFGSSIPGSAAISTVDWIYCNTWRVGSASRHYVGIWKGFDPNSFTGYHLPTKVVSDRASIVGNALVDPTSDFVAAGVALGDILVVDDGPNKGSYPIASTPTAHTLTIGPMWPLQPSVVAYRIIKETDWTQPHRYRLVKDPSGSEVSILLDTDTVPLLFVDYDNSTLPSSALGLPRVIAGTVPSILWGAFDPTNISQTAWDYVRYGVTRSPTEIPIAPHHEVLNQRNVIASPEHLTTNIAHSHTDFWSSSTGIPPHLSPDFLQNSNLIAFTLLNEGTPLVPSTETYQVRQPTPIKVFVGGLNTPTNVLNNNGFKLNEPGVEVKILVPDDVLYSQLSVIERDTGETSLIAPFSDQEAPGSYGPINYQNEVCLTYDGSVLPENDTAAPTPWVFDADDPTHVNRSAFAGILTYGTDATGTKSIYRNATPLPDSIALGLEVKFRLKVLLDGTGGLGDSQIRFGFSAFGMTLALAFVTAPTGLRYVICYDLGSGTVVGGTPFDFYDSNYHVYRIVRAPGAPMMRIFIDS